MIRRSRSRERGFTLSARGFTLSARGFTLMEVLIAMTITGVVMALSMQGFMHSKKLSDWTRSKVVAADEAARGLQQVSLLLKRAHVVYFTATPLELIETNARVNTVLAAGAGNLPADQSMWAPIPPSLGTLAGGANTVPYNFVNRLSRLYNNDVGWAPATIGSFRFFEPIAARNGGGFQSVNRLVSAAPAGAVPPAPLTAAFNTTFSSPLIYIAEVEFQDSTPDAVNQTNVGALYPFRWNFHVLYLAPMRLSGRTDPQIPLDRNRQASDLGGPTGATWARSTVPFELRLFSIYDVFATRTGATPSTVAAATGWRRDAKGILPFPFDQFNGQVNYHPVPLTMAPGSQNTLITNSPRLNPAAPSGERVNAAGIHPNFGNIGNDPPNETALGVRANARLPRDRVIAKYVDPDNVHGTSVRIQSSTNPTWVNPYGAPGYLWTNNAPRPNKALISVATRYRNDIRVPFQFATETIEVELEALTRFQTIDYTTRL